jgi:hypothetical protein
MTYHGSVKGGVIVLEPGVELPEGAPVRVEFEPLPEQAEVGPLDPAFTIADLAVETGIPDLATNIDAYLYGHPKATNGG